MRILWLNHRDIRHPRAGGAERTILEVGRRLVSYGHEVHLVAGSAFGAADYDCEGIKVKAVAGSISPHLVVPAIVRGPTPPDVVIDDLAHAVPWMSPLVTKIPVVAFFRHLHGRTLVGQVPRPAASILQLAERTYRYIYRNSGFVVESLQSESDLRDLGVPGCRIVRIPPGVDSTLFSPGARYPVPTFVYFGGMRRYKRPADAVAAFARARSALPESRLLIVGDGPALPEVTKQIVREGLQESARLLGYLPRERLSHIVRASWVNIHCALAEGWGYSILEAAAAGVATAAYRVPGVADTILDGVSGLSVPDSDRSSLAHAMVEIATRLPTYSSSARAWALRFDWEASSRNWERALLNAATAS